MTKDQAIIAAKTFRKDADELLQRMKDHARSLSAYVRTSSEYDNLIDGSEVIAQHILATRDLEGAIMRQGMVLKYIGNPNPYPDSKDPSNTVVNPTADGLKM